MKFLSDEAGFTLLEMVIATLLTAVLVVLVGGILWAGIQGFNLGAGDYAASGELVLFGHYLQQDAGSTQPGNVVLGTPNCDGNLGSSDLTLTWTDPAHAATSITAFYHANGSELWRDLTVGGTTTTAVVAHHLSSVCFTFLPQAAEVQATLNMNVSIYSGEAHQYSGTVTAYDEAAAP